jgi:hypothetical protein
MINEDQVEQLAIEWFKELRYERLPVRLRQCT